MDNHYDEVKALIEDNAYRPKTTEQKVREASELDRIESERAKERQEQTQFGSDMVRDELTHTDSKGRTRDIVAKKVGLGSGRQYERAKNVIKEIDALKESGNTDDAEILTDILILGHLYR